MPSILVKTREGRPIHIEGNKLSTVTGGGVNANVNSSVLSLYDSTRIQSPFIGETANQVAEAKKAFKDFEVRSQRLSRIGLFILSLS